MSLRRSPAVHKPRELRRRVIVPARLRHGAAWSDACILNISSRGLMIQTGRPIGRGSEIEIYRGDHVIVAEVVWREGARAGLKAEGRVPIEEIMVLGQAPGLQLTAIPRERRSRPRPEGRDRQKGRLIEFAGVLLIAVSLAGAGLSMVQATFARSLAVVSMALSR